MQSMIKRKIEISMNAHVDMIQQLVADAYEIQKERQIRGVIDPICSGNILLRQHALLQNAPPDRTYSRSEETTF
ncbi:putative histone-like protein [Salmonella phage rabagast]|uniref:Putative histone-like protein n=1 Tax=Salmonella phage rabagast TaxID=2713314 RepID=A0A6G9LBB1_9CAUD|nr:histone family DNA-binding [Salmonella phage rabagast]QIQ61842.1 putative histone-like protein [Salmonella phage rabagast]